MGGSNKRMVTGKPDISSNSRVKSSACAVSNAAIAVSTAVSKACCAGLFAGAAFGASNNKRRLNKREGSKNICSVRASPMPSAPKRRARAASSGVSALARIRKTRWVSAHAITLAKSPESSGSSVATCPSITLPLLPSMVSTSPSRNWCAPISTDDLSASMRMAVAPQMHGRPKPRATTAAWLVMPPRAVKMPRAAYMP